jgi:hypothetical protein
MGWYRIERMNERPPGPTNILALKLTPEVARVLHRAQFETCRTKKALVEAAIMQAYGEAERAA